MISHKTGLAALFIIFFVIGFFPVRDAIFDDALSTELAGFIEAYRYPENILDNAYLDFIGLMRPPEQSLENFKALLSSWRKNYDIYNPEKTLNSYADNNALKFIGEAWLYNCWLSPTPSEGPCVQPHAFEQTSLDKNALILRRYENALGKTAFYADPLVDLNDEFVSAAFLYLASSSYYANKGDWNEAVTRWSRQHTALFRFINDGHYSLQTFTRLAQLYYTSLKTAERLVYTGLPPRYWPTLESVLNRSFDISLHTKQVMAQEVGFYHDQMQRYYHPVFHGLKLSRLHNQLSTVPTNRLFNSIQWKKGDDNKTADDNTTTPKTPQDVIAALSSYLSSRPDDIHNLTYLNALQNALLLGIRLKQADIYGDAAQEWLDIQAERNPFTNEPYRYNEAFKCLYFEDDHGEQACIFLPTFIPQTPLPADGDE